MNTFEAPIICVAFYPCKKHELADGRVIDGNEFRLMEYSEGFNSKKMLSGILGVQLQSLALAVVALRCEGTKSKDLTSYRTMLKEMWLEASSRSSGNLKP